MELGRKFLPPPSGSPGPKVRYIWMPFPFVVLIDQRQIPSSCFTFLEKPKVSIMQIYFPPPNFYQTTTVLFPEEQLSSLSFSDNSPPPLFVCFPHNIPWNNLRLFLPGLDNGGGGSPCGLGERRLFIIFSCVSFPPIVYLWESARGKTRVVRSRVQCAQCKESINYSVPFSFSVFQLSEPQLGEGIACPKKKKRNGFSGFRRKK